MKKMTFISIVSAAFALSIGLTTQTASALICCSQCYGYPPPLPCKNGCSPTCEEDEPPTLEESEVSASLASESVVYDETIGACYVAEAG